MSEIRGKCGRMHIWALKPLKLPEPLRRQSLDPSHKWLTSLVQFSFCMLATFSLQSCTLPPWQNPGSTPENGFIWARMLHYILLICRLSVRLYFYTYVYFTDTLVKPELLYKRHASLNMLNNNGKTEWRNVTGDLWLIFICIDLICIHGLHKTPRHAPILLKMCKPKTST